MIKPKLKPAALLLLLVTSVLGVNLSLEPKAAAARDIAFPVIGRATFVNDYNYARSGGRIHHATDVMADKGQMLVAAAAGTIIDVQYPQPSWGYSVTIQDDDGYSYSYLHINDDTPGTNDGAGGGMEAYGVEMKEGNRVARGQLIGWVGDSGNSNGIPHLHFEMYQPDDDVMNPYQSLVHATHIAKPVTPGRVTAEVLPFGRYKTGAANVAMGNFDLDPASEYVVGGGKNNIPVVQVYQDNNVLTKEFYVYGKSFRGGIDVAVGDMDGDGIDEIITGAGPGAGPKIKIFEADGTKIQDFLTYGSSVQNGLKVAAGDVNGDTRDEVIVGLGSGTEPRVKVYNFATNAPVLLDNFLAYKSTFRGGVDVAAGNIDAVSAFDEIVTAPGRGGQPQIRVFQADGTFSNDFLAYGAGMKGGVRLSIGNVRTNTATSEIATVPASGWSPYVGLFNNTGTAVAARYFAEEWWLGGYDVAAGFDTSQALAGSNRRVSIRLGID